MDFPRAPASWQRKLLFVELERGSQGGELGRGLFDAPANGGRLRPGQLRLRYACMATRPVQGSTPWPQIASLARSRPRKKSAYQGAPAIDALQRFLLEEEKRGSIEIFDPNLRPAFWTAVADETWADGVATGHDADAVFTIPPWQVESRP